MTPVGHSLAGIAIGVVCLPKDASTRWKGVYFVVLAILANIPDMPLRHWGHDRYDISHSLFVNFLVVIVIVPCLLLPSIRPYIKRRSVVLAATAAELSHLLLDSFYNHGNGIAVYWPVSRARLVLPIPWFSVLPNSPPPFTLRHFQTYGVELAAYGSLVILAIVMRHALQSRRTR